MQCISMLVGALSGFHMLPLFSSTSKKNKSLQHQCKAKLNKTYSVSCSFLKDIFLIHILGIQQDCHAILGSQLCENVFLQCWVVEFSFLDHKYKLITHFFILHWHRMYVHCLRQTWDKQSEIFGRQSKSLIQLWDKSSDGGFRVSANKDRLRQNSDNVRLRALLLCWLFSMHRSASTTVKACLLSGYIFKTWQRCR